MAVLIPALDEEESLPAVIRALPPDVGTVVVVDNGSVDDTARVARLAGAQVVTEPDRGYGAACLAGIDFLRQSPRPPDVIVFVDADHSDRPEELPVLVAPILEGRADLVLGARTAASGHPIPLHARLGNRVVLRAVRWLFGRSFKDLGPFRAISVEALDRLAMDDRNWGWTLQMQIRAVRQGLRIEEVPLPYRRRTAGRSKVSGSVSGSVRAGLKMVYTLLRERARSAKP